jgi:hypothetical protein
MKLNFHDLEEMRNLYEQGKRAPVIAEIKKIHPETVVYWQKKLLWVRLVEPEPYRHKKIIIRKPTIKAKHYKDYLAERGITLTGLSWDGIKIPYIGKPTVVIRRRMVCQYCRVGRYIRTPSIDRCAICLFKKLH